MKNTVVLLVGLLFSAFSVFAQDVVVETSTPDKDIILKFCRETYYSGQNRVCYTREFLERRGNDFVFLIQEDGNPEKKEQVFALQDGYFGIRSRPMGVPQIYVPHAFQVKFPLQVGTHWSGSWIQTGTAVLQRTRTAEVISYEDVKPKAGTFKGFEVRSYNQRLGVRNPARERYYFSPELFALILYESPDFDMREVLVEVRRASVSVSGAK